MSKAFCVLLLNDNENIFQTEFVIFFVRLVPMARSREFPTVDSIASFISHRMQISRMYALFENNL